MIINLHDIKKDIDNAKNKNIVNSKTLQIHKTIIDEEELRRKEDMNKSRLISTRDINKTWNNIMDIGWLSTKQYSLGPFEGIEGAWRNKPAFVIGSGPDLKVFIEKVGWNFLDDKNTIGINHVIESYDKFKWFFFLDRRFILKTTYDLKNFEGKIFAQNNTGIDNVTKNVIRFKGKPSSSYPTENIRDGLYSNCFSGLAALHLAILSGANPIYMIGFGMGKDGNETDYHFRKNYQGVGQRPKEQYNKYLRVYNGFNKFKKWFPAITHVTEGKSLAKFKKLSFEHLIDKFKYKKTNENYVNININKGVQPKIVHLSFSDNVEIHADITRAIIKNCYGHHSMNTFNNIPPADLYITEHFISTDKHIQKFPYKNKTINIVHSMNCYPQGNFKFNIALTNNWAQILKRKQVNNIKVIYGGIDLKPYENVNRNKEEKIFGRITRWSPGKIPFWWNRLVTEILNEDQNINCLMFIDNRNRSRELLNHKRMIYDYSCKINDFKGDWLKKLNIYVHANGSFKETLSFACIEAMATGLPIIYLKEPAINEVVGSAGIAVNNETELKNMIMKLLYDDSLCESYSKLSKQRAKIFDINKSIEEWNKLIKENV